MPYPAPHLVVRINGRFGAPAPGVEIWSTGFKAQVSGPATESNMAALLEDLVAPVSTFFNFLPCGTRTYLTELTCAFVGTDGTYEGAGTQATTRLAVGPTAGTGSAIHPLATSLVVSLKTDVVRGPGSNGRMYWPAISAGLTGDAMLYENAATVAPAAATFISACNTQLAAEGRPFGPIAVFSKVGSGRIAPVNSVRVGKKLDSQERREDGLDESYASAAVPGALFTRRDRVIPVTR